MSTLLEELIKSFRYFIARDLIFIVAGGYVVGAFLYCFKSVPAADDSWILFFLLGGLGYFLAYGLQDLLSILWCLPTTPVREPSRIVRWIFERYEHQKWASIDKELPSGEVRHKIAPELRPELERLIMLQQIGTAGGPCILLSGFLFLAAWWVRHQTLDLVVALVGFALGLSLIALAWLKAAQRARFIVKYVKDADATVYSN